MSAINRQNNPIFHEFSGTATTPSQSQFVGKSSLSQLVSKTGENFDNIFLRITGDKTIISPVTKGIYQDVLDLYLNGGSLPEGWEIISGSQSWGGMSNFAFTGLASDLSQDSGHKLLSLSEKDQYNSTSSQRLKFNFDSLAQQITQFTQKWADGSGNIHDLTLPEFAGEILKNAPNGHGNNPYTTLTNNGAPGAYTNDSYITKNDYYIFLNMVPEITGSSSTGFEGRVYLPLRPEEEQNIQAEYMPFIMFSNDQNGDAVTSKFCETHYDSTKESGRKAYVSFIPNRADIGAIPCIQLTRITNIST